LKAYQEFLSQTQAQELERFRDIDTVTEEFIDRFKAELAYNIPLDDLQDKRMFLKNLREFYLSRGSEASYKFIFKTFFNKDVEIFYPSKQMLRASDGKWKQDVSIFVKNTSTSTSLFPLSGNYINIDSNGKRLVSYVENVVQYSNDVFEIFIQRDIVKTIEVGATISYIEDETQYSGNVLLTPRSIKVLKPGKGFKVGDIFNLRTNLGEGCRIKVTQVDGNGGIIRAKILKFSLDYSANFWSYLNAKDGAVPVPQSFSESGGIQTLTLADIASSNINESGIISRQNYMFYDTSIPTAQESQGANRFFADTSYVGQVDSQIYADNLADYNPEELALIEVQVGACSIYSGYYLSQDGFISDEIYIQDSNYYQAFSYVIKVEEELRKYADLVKTILHPAGMKMFAEFQIYNNINISATSIFSNRVIQISDSFTIFNQGIAYSDYDVTYDVNEDFVHTPKPGAGIILTPFNTLAYILGKKLSSQLQTNADSVVKFVGKNISTDFYNINDEYPVKLIEKPFINAFQVSLQSFIKDVEKSNIFSIFSTNTISVNKSVDKIAPNESQTIDSLTTKQFGKNVQASQYVISSSIGNKSVEKPSLSSTLVSSAINQKIFETSFPEEFVSTQSNASKLFDLNSNQSLYEATTLYVDVIPEKRFTSQYILGSSLQPTVFSKRLDTAISVQDPNAITLIATPISDVFQITEVFDYVNGALREFSSGFSTTSSQTEDIGKFTSSAYSVQTSSVSRDIARSSINLQYTASDNANLSPLIPFSSNYSTTSAPNNLYQKALQQLNVVVSSSVLKSSARSSINLQYTASDNANLSPLIPFSSNYSTTSAPNNLYQKALQQLNVVVSSSVLKSSAKSLSSVFAIGDVNAEDFSRGIVNDSISVADDSFEYILGTLRQFSSQLSVSSAINNKDTAKTLSQLTITTSSVITSRQPNKTISSGVSTDDSGVLKLNSYDLGDYFYPNAIDYQNDVVSIT
jgi:hypothetical protein